MQYGQNGFSTTATEQNVITT